jgi:hypothetical protein
VKPANISLAGIDDAELRAAMADLIADLGATTTSVEGDPAVAALVLVESAQDLDGRIAATRASLPAAMVLVLLPFSESRLTWRALALGATACHALDQPTDNLARALREMLAIEHASPTDARAEGVTR